jgi:hypothetical protein
MGYQMMENFLLTVNWEIQEQSHAVTYEWKDKLNPTPFAVGCSDGTFLRLLAPVSKERAPQHMAAEREAVYIR